MDNIQYSLCMSNNEWIKTQSDVIDRWPYKEILEVLRDSKISLTPKEITLKADEEVQQLKRVRIYNILEILTDLGLIQKEKIGHRKVEYYAKS